MCSLQQQMNFLSLKIEGKKREKNEDTLYMTLLTINMCRLGKIVKCRWNKKKEEIETMSKCQSMWLAGHSVSILNVNKFTIIINLREKLPLWCITSPIWKTKLTCYSSRQLLSSARKEHSCHVSIWICIQWKWTNNRDFLYVTITTDSKVFFINHTKYSKSNNFKWPLSLSLSSPNNLPSNSFISHKYIWNLSK